MRNNNLKIGDKFRRFMSAVWRHKYVWTIAIFVVLVGFVDENSFWHRYRLKAENEATEAEIKQYEDKFDHDNAKLHQLKTDPRAVLRVAREDHQMKSPDEDVYYITYTDSAAAQ